MPDTKHTFNAPPSRGLAVLSEEQLRDVLALKERVAEKIERCHKELEMLEKESAVLDDILKQSSFARASSLPRSAPASDDGPEPTILVWKKERREIGSARITPERIFITLEEWVSLDAETPPFKSFFMDKIIGDMRKKDLDDGITDPIECTVDRKGTDIKTITIARYRDPDRAREITNTVEWSLNRMLERAAE